jgi:predicted metal-dependent RNase
VYTGDFKFGKAAVVDTASWNFPRVETLIMEGLYGSRDDLFPSAEEAYSKLVVSLNKTIAENGRILIPISSVGLSQELVLSLDKFIKSGQLTKTKIYLEKIITETNSIHELYAEYLARDLRERMQDERDNLFSSEQFEEIDSGEFGEDSPAIILAPSSMLTGGPAVHYLKMISGEPKSKLILLSYQAPSTPGSGIKGGQREITICNQRINTICQVEVIEGLGTHSDYNQLLAYANKLRPKLKRILVNHGERSKVQNLATSINRMFKIQTQFPLVGEGIKLL